MSSDTFSSLPSDQQKKILDGLISCFAKSKRRFLDYEELGQSTGLSKDGFSLLFPTFEDALNLVSDEIRQTKMKMVGAMTKPGKSRDTFAYLRWLVQVAVLFELRYPALASIERSWRKPYRPQLELAHEEASEELDSNPYKNMMVQGVLHDDIASWVDTDMATYLVTTAVSECAPYLIERMGSKADALRNGTVDIVYDPYVQDLFDSFMDLLEAGMARDPQMRKDFYAK